MEQNKILPIIIFIIISLTSCNNALKTENCNENVVISKVITSSCDSMIYELQDEATNTLLKMVVGKKVSHCHLFSSMKENQYSFSFPYDDKTLYTHRDTLLLNKTNIYLKLGNKYYPVITELDSRFSNIPRDEYAAINDFNSCHIVVNTQGKVVSSFAY